MSGSVARPLCSQAATTIPRQCASRFSARWASSFTSLRSLLAGTMRATPSSVAFCRIQSIFSPRAMPCSRVIRSGDSLSTRRIATICARASRLPMATMRAS